VNDGLLGPLEGLDGAPDEVLSAGRQDLEPNIVGYGSRGLDQAPGEVEVGLRCRGEGHLNLLVAKIAQQAEVLPLLVSVHGVNQALVAVPKVCRQPSRGLVDGLAGPLAVGEVERGELLVLLGGVLEHRHLGGWCGDGRIRETSR